jgi:hypothetical protein
MSVYYGIIVDKETFYNSLAYYKYGEKDYKLLLPLIKGYMEDWEQNEKFKENKDLQRLVMHDGATSTYFRHINIEFSVFTKLAIKDYHICG